MLGTQNGPAQLVLRRIGHHHGVSLQNVIMDNLNGLLGNQEFRDSVKCTTMISTQLVKLNVCAFGKLLMLKNPSLHRGTCEIFPLGGGSVGPHGTMGREVKAPFLHHSLTASVKLEGSMLILINPVKARM
jgi:hypothetical protein